MAITDFEFLRFRKKKQAQNGGGEGVLNSTEEREKVVRDEAAAAIANVEVDLILLLTRKQWRLIRISSFLYVLSCIFLLLVEIGNTHNKPVLRDSYFLKIDVSDILPSTSPADAQLVNSIARSLGIHDFYQVGLWNFCEGYDDEGITDCSKPQNLWWFNPVAIIMSELLYGATIALPSEITTILKLIHIVSNLMFSFFLLSILTSFLLIFLSPLVLLSVWYSYHFVTFAFISALLTFAGSTTATVMYVIFQKVITSQKELNIGAKLGPRMFAFMWLGTVFSIAGWAVHLHLAIVSRKKHHATKKDREKKREEEGKSPRRCPQLSLPAFWRRREARRSGGEVVIVVEE
ncbi:SUR7/PalI family domain containing protein [Hyaloscypha variabilis]